MKEGDYLYCHTPIYNFCVGNYYQIKEIVNTLGISDTMIISDEHDIGWLLSKVPYNFYTLTELRRLKLMEIGISGK